MINREQASAVSQLLALVQLVKPMVDNPRAIKDTLEGFKEAEELMEKSKGFVKTLADIEQREAALKEASERIEASHKLSVQKEELANQGLENLKSAREQFVADVKEHDKKVSDHVARENNLNQREKDINARGVAADKAQAEADAQKSTYAQKLSVLNNLEGAK